ncbi:hypothetical protein QJS10_CPB15g00903 [Acorus calamus]|uniref:Uncharacterized protein n=1 Tax=Acorus calamus TaxID=4465 RepID=A0AAV9D6T7_ACOCL|nr:hypothetical protein QJS10_CPB15g00903 [Acorus calamus]
MSVENNNGITYANGLSASTKRKGRGKTVMTDYWTCKMAKLPIEWNELGKPVGDAAKTLSSYIGVVTRSGLLPLDIPD